MTQPTAEKPAAQPIIKGWCPGALRPMMSGDGLVVRLRPRGGRLSQAQAMALADLSLAFGNGVLDLSSRANVQIRGVTVANHPALLKALRGLNLIDPNPDAESRRNILITPFWEKGDVAPQIAARLEAALEQEDAPPLPAKFGFAIDTGPLPALRDASADIRIEARNGGLLLRAEGMTTGAATFPEAAAQDAIALARWFIDSRGAAKGRMATHIARGFQPEQASLPMAERPLPRPLPGPTAQGYLVGTAFGQLTAETLRGLAHSGALRLTPWRLLLLERVTAPPPLPELITRPDDPLLRVIACTGAPACPQGLGPTRSLARRLAPALKPGQCLHISGCAKGCAHPTKAQRVLVATSNGYGLIKDGQASAPASGLYSAATLLASPDLIFETNNAP